MHRKQIEYIHSLVFGLFGFAFVLFCFFFNLTYSVLGRLSFVKIKHILGFKMQ